MFVGHYGPSLAIKASRNSIPLWVLFVAVQLLDACWSIFVLLGVEKVRIVPGITATNPLDLYYMPYTHSLIGRALVLCRRHRVSRVSQSGRLVTCGIGWRRGVLTLGAGFSGAPPRPAVV